jgi:hypothetical protein
VLFLLLILFIFLYPLAILLLPSWLEFFFCCNYSPCNLFSSHLLVPLYDFLQKAQEEVEAVRAATDRVRAKIGLLATYIADETEREKKLTESSHEGEYACNLYGRWMMMEQKHYALLFHYFFI